MSLVNERIRLPCRPEMTAEVGIACGKAIHHPVYHHLRHLGSGWIVEVGTEPAAVPDLKGREMLAGSRNAETGGHGEIPLRGTS
jgi:hypothetical protein